MDTISTPSSGAADCSSSLTSAGKGGRGHADRDVGGGQARGGGSGIGRGAVAPEGPTTHRRRRLSGGARQVGWTWGALPGDALVMVLSVLRATPPSSPVRRATQFSYAGQLFHGYSNNMNMASYIESMP